MPKYPVIEPLNHDQQDYAVGSEVELTEVQALALQRVGAVGEAIPGSDSGNGQLTVPKTVELVNAVQTVEELDAMETNETRKGVLDAIAKKRLEFQQ